MAVRRREFLSAPLLASPFRLNASPAPLRAHPFPLRQVRLLDSPVRDAMEKNRRYLHDLETDRLLHTFRVTAGLPPAAPPMGGWEAPDVELRGHFTGHYLSACAVMFQAAGDDALRAKAEAMVADLAKCQKAAGAGYLSAFPAELFDRLRDGKKVWAPWYTWHKIMAGLLDQHLLCGNRQALEVAAGMADWTRKWVDPLSEEHMQRVLDVEHGGMLETLASLSAATGDRRHLETAARFVHRKFFDPLAAGRDQLKGLHVNTQIPKVIGAARRHELTGDLRDRDIADFFWRQVTGRRAYCTGGTSNQEGWRTEPDQLAAELSATTQECCCTYNLLKLTRHLFQWTADARLADYYERALFNGILGTMNPRDGLTMYYVPLASGYWKIFGRPRDSFWCCTGTGVESFSKLADSIYFHEGRTLFVNLFIASQLDWPEHGFKLRQETRFPDESRTRLIVESNRAARLELRVRMPYWLAGQPSVRVNGELLEGQARPGSYWSIDRRWKNGDRLDVALPMGLRTHPMPDDPGLQALMYGPLVLAGDLGGEGLTGEMRHGNPKEKVSNHYLVGQPVAAPELRASAKDPAAWIHPEPGASLTFRTRGQARDVTLIPLNRIVDQRYAVYWRVRGPGA